MVALVTLLSVTDDRTPVPGFFDLPVTGGTATFDMLGLHPEERGSAITLLARSMFSQGGNAAERAGGVRRFITSLSLPENIAANETEARPITIAVPLTADHWRDLLGPQTPRDLFAGLLSNRAVLLVCAGAMNTDASTRALLCKVRRQKSARKASLLMLTWLPEARADSISSSASIRSVMPASARFSTTNWINGLPSISNIALGLLRPSG